MINLIIIIKKTINSNTIWSPKQNNLINLCKNTNKNTKKNLIFG